MTDLNYLNNIPENFNINDSNYEFNNTVNFTPQEPTEEELKDRNSSYNKVINPKYNNVGVDIKQSDYELSYLDDAKIETGKTENLYDDYKYNEHNSLNYIVEDDNKYVNSTKIDDLPNVELIPERNQTINTRTKELSKKKIVNTEPVNNLTFYKFLNIISQSFIDIMNDLLKPSNNSNSIFNKIFITITKDKNRILLIGFILVILSLFLAFFREM